jgi:MFS family permease
MFDRDLWVRANFRRMFLAAGATNLGDGVIAVALPWMATLLTTDAFLIGLVAAGRHAPWFLFALPAGVLTDRFDHRRILIGADLFRLVVAAALVVLALTASPGTGPALALAALSFALGSAEVLRDNTAQTFVPQLVERHQLERANSALWSTETLAGQFIGPPLAGMLIGLALALPFGLMTVMLAVAVVLATGMKVPPRPPKPHQPMASALQEGLTWLWAHPTLRRLAIVLGGFNFLGYGYTAVLVLYGQRVLGLDAFGYGAFLMLVALGGLTGTFIGPAILDRIGPTWGLMLGVGSFTLAMLTLAMAPPIWVVGAVMVFEGFFGMMWSIATVSYRQRHIPPELLGRVNSVYRFIGTGPAAFGALAFGAIIAWGDRASGISAEAVLLPFWIAGIGGALLWAYTALRIRLD